MPVGGVEDAVGTQRVPLGEEDVLHEGGPGLRRTDVHEDPLGGGAHERPSCRCQAPTHASSASSRVRPLSTVAAPGTVGQMGGRDQVTGVAVHRVLSPPEPLGHRGGGLLGPGARRRGHPERRRLVAGGRGWQHRRDQAARQLAHPARPLGEGEQPVETPEQVRLGRVGPGGQRLLASAEQPGGAGGHVLGVGGDHHVDALARSGGQVLGDVGQGEVRRQPGGHRPAPDRGPLHDAAVGWTAPSARPSSPRPAGP